MPVLNLAAMVSGYGFTALQSVAFIVGYVLSALAGVFISIEAFFLGVALQLNFDIINSPTVSIGFSIILAFANILFVAAMIVMAVATIVRYNAYGVKQLLLKIVIAAIGVNFSLVLVGIPISFSDQMSSFFISRSVPGTAQSTGGEDYTLGNIGAFASRIAGAFSPQQAFLYGQGAGSEQKSAGDFITQTANAPGGMMAAILSVFITFFVLMQIVIFLGVLIAAFFLRYIWLGLLLILLPGVWVAWIFPFSQAYVKRWMHHFIKWTFFGPVALFFLYLALRITDVLTATHFVTALGSLDNASTGLVDALQKGLSVSLKPVIELALKSALVGGAMWGGLYLASKMGIGLAGTGANAMSSIANSAKRQVTNRAKNAGLRTFDRARTAGKDSDGNSRLQRLGSSLSTLGSKSRIARLTGVGAAGSAVSKLGVADSKGPQARIGEYKKDLGGLTKEALVTELERLSTGSLMANPDREAAILELLKDKKGLGDIKKNMDARISEAALTKDNGMIGIVEDPTARAEAEKRERERIEKLFKRQSNAGNLKDILAVSPELARYAPLGLRKGSETDKITEDEAVAAALSSLKSENIINVANNAKLFAGDDKANPNFGQTLNVLALNNTLLKGIGDINISTIDKIDTTIDYLDQLLADDRAAGDNKKWEEHFKSLGLKDEAAIKAHKSNTEIKLRALRKTMEKSINFEARRARRTGPGTLPTIDLTSDTPS